MKKIILFFLITIISLGVGCSDDDNSTTTENCYTSSSTTTTTSSTGSYDIVDTDQVKCYNSGTGAEVSCVGTGYDAAYNTANQSSYTTGGGGTVVTDNITGLMWTQSSDTNGDGSVDYSDKMSQNSAVSYCENLSLGGYEDWRLPDIKTLYSLILFSGEDASSYTGTDTSGLVPFIDSSFDWAFGDQDEGDRIIDAQYASTTTYVSTTMEGDTTMFGVNFIDGRIKGYPCETKIFYVRCVRDNTDYGLNNFTDNGNGTISDNATSLMWESGDSASTDLDDAISTCESATTGGHSDWRLPNVKELQSILDYTRSPDTTSSAAINSLFTATSFTNEEGETDWAYYWSSTTHVDYDSSGKAGAYVSFGRALGYMANAILDVHGAGAQRSNYKIDVDLTTGTSSIDAGYGTFWYHGPQGDILRSDNRVRCVRDLP